MKNNITVEKKKLGNLEEPYVSKVKIKLIIIYPTPNVVYTILHINI